MRVLTLVALASSLLVALADQAADDEIGKLPGVDFELNFKHYSGFLQASETHFLHYWFVERCGCSTRVKIGNFRFVESQNNPAVGARGVESRECRQ